MKITTNNRERELFALDQIPAEQQSEFDYIEGDERHDYRLFRFRDSWWDMGNFEWAGDDLKAKGWDGVMGTSYFDAVVLRYFDRDGHELEGVVVGHATW